VTDNQIVDRVKAVLAGASAETKTSEHPVVVPGAMNPNQALQVLTLAQRTAEEHVAIANRHADKIRNDAQAAADQVGRDAQVHAHNVRREADKVLGEARAASEQAARDARERADEARRNADQILAEARAAAATIANDAQGHAEQLKFQAQQRYEDSVGSLRAKREALQQQIEALEQFDREYRARLTSFMQAQLRALWVDEPQVDAEPESPAAPPPTGAASAPKHGPEPAKKAKSGDLHHAAAK
jgi:cell division septum initiation protein DivIVA